VHNWKVAANDVSGKVDSYAERQLCGDALRTPLALDILALWPERVPYDEARYQPYP
jgi:hypothetical protein